MLNAFKRLHVLINVCLMVSLLFSGLAAAEVVSEPESTQKGLRQNASPHLFNKDAPMVIGESTRFIVLDCTITIRLDAVITGDNANRIVLKTDPENELPESGRQYYIAKFVIAVEGDGKLVKVVSLSGQDDFIQHLPRWRLRDPATWFLRPSGWDPKLTLKMGETGELLCLFVDRIDFPPTIVFQDAVWISLAPRQRRF